jgi:hypothetical protein
MLEKLKNYLLYVDIFGQRLDLTYNREIYYRTYYGCVFTILIITFLFFQGLSGYKELTTRLNPIINIIEVEEDKVSTIELFDGNITIALGFVSDNRSEHLYDPSYFVIESTYISKSTNSSNEIIKSFQIDNIKCDIQNFKNFENLFEIYGLREAICLKPEGIAKKLEIFSDLKELTETYLKFSIKYCSNTSDNMTCKPIQEIKERLSDLNLYLYIIHDYFDGSDINNPIKKRLSMQKWTFEDSIVRRKDSIFLSAGSMKDYNSLFMTLFEPAVKKFVGYSEKDIIRNFRLVNANEIKSSEKLIEIFIRGHATPLKIVRKYNTAIDLVATLGGLFNVFYIFGNLIFSYVGRILFDIRMINDNFNILRSRKKIELNEIDKFGRVSKSFSFNKHDDIPFAKKSFSTLSFMNDNDSNSNKCEHLVKKKKYKLKYTLKDIIYSILICLKDRKTLDKKNEIYHSCKKIIDSYLDIKNLISIMQEFKVVRSVMFDNIQLSLIDYYKKPILKVCKDESNKILLVYRKSTIEEMKDEENIHEIRTSSEINKNIKILKDRFIQSQDELDKKIIEMCKFNSK